MTPDKKIKKIIDDLGISTEIQAKAMNVRVQTVYNKQNEKVITDKFNEKNYKNLVNYIKEKIKKL